MMCFVVWNMLFLGTTCFHYCNECSDDWNRRHRNITNRQIAFKRLKKESSFQVYVVSRCSQRLLHSFIFEILKSLRIAHEFSVSSPNLHSFCILRVLLDLYGWHVHRNFFLIRAILPHSLEFNWNYSHSIRFSQCFNFITKCLSPCSKCSFLFEIYASKT